MRPVTYSMSCSLDGYVVDEDGDFDWSVPDEEVFAHHLHDLRGTSVHLLGRKLHETMLFWETADEDQELDYANQEWARMWRALPKIVLSRTLTEVTGSNTRLATGTLEEEIKRLRAESGEGEIALGGAELAAEAARLDLIDEYRPVVHPVLIGGGRPFFPPVEQQRALELVSSKTFGSGVVASRYRVRR